MQERRHHTQSGTRCRTAVGTAQAPVADTAAGTVAVPLRSRDPQPGMQQPVRRPAVHTEAVHKEPVHTEQLRSRELEPLRRESRNAAAAAVVAGRRPS